MTIVGKGCQGKIIRPPEDSPLSLMKILLQGMYAYGATAGKLYCRCCRRAVLCPKFWSSGSC